MLSIICLVCTFLEYFCQISSCCDIDIIVWVSIVWHQHVAILRVLQFDFFRVDIVNWSVERVAIDLKHGFGWRDLCSSQLWV